MTPVIRDTSPFENARRGSMPVTWVKPKLVCEIKFTEWTKDRIARHPIFMGLRVDKKANEVSFEKSTTMKQLKEKTAKNKKVSETKKANSNKTSTINKKSASLKTSAKSAKSTKSAQSAIQSVILNNHEIKLTNLDKPYWKKEGFTKGDMINYYLKIAPYIMPYMKDRPQSMNRHPNGIDAPNFFQKDT